MIAIVGGLGKAVVGVLVSIEEYQWNPDKNDKGTGVEWNVIIKRERERQTDLSHMISVFVTEVWGAVTRETPQNETSHFIYHTDDMDWFQRNPLPVILRELL